MESFIHVWFCEKVVHDYCISATILIRVTKEVHWLLWYFAIV